MKVLRRAALCLALLAPAVAAAAESEGGSGFLSDYAQLQPVPGNPGLMRYAVPDVRARLASKVVLAPIEIWLSPTSKYKGIDPDEMKRLTDELRTVIVNELQPRFRFVEAGDPEAMILRIALTNVNLDKDPVRLRHFTPIGLAVKGVKAAAGVSPYRLQSAAIEAEGYAPDGRERLFATVDRRSGSTGNPGEVRWDQLVDDIRERAKRMRGVLESAAR